jgi:hypothetical protein
MHKAVGALDRNPRWSLIPALTFSGLVSAIFSLWIWFPAGSAFVLLVSLSFVLALGAVLWFYDLINTWRMLAASVGVTLTAHLLALYGELHLPQRSQEYVEISRLGSIRPQIALMSFAVACILCVAFLMFTRPRCKIGWAVGITFACASLEAATVAAVDGTQRGAWISLFTGSPSPPSLLWQPSLAFFLAIALVIKGLIPRSHVCSQDRPCPSLRSRFAGLGILLVFWVITGTWTLAFDVREAKRIHELQARLKAERSQSLAEAPRFENLPASASKPLNQVLLLQEINGWKPYIPSSWDYPAQNNSGEMYAPFPERKTYSVRYATAGNDQGVVDVHVTEYPNAEWAKYEVRNTPMAYEFIDHANSIKHLTRFGNNLFRDDPYFIWASDQKLIFLDCQGVMPDVIDEFLKAYLMKYPSSL